MTSTPTSQSATVSDPASNYAGAPKGCSDYGNGCRCNLCKDMDYWIAQKAAATPKPQIPQPQYPAAQVNGLSGFSAWLPKPFEPLAAEAKVQYGYNCAKCNCRNEYAGPEHLKNGVYICYECK